MPIAMNTNAVRTRRPADAPQVAQNTVNSQESSAGGAPEAPLDRAAVFESSAVSRSGPAERVADFVGSYVNDRGDSMDITMEDGRLKLNGSFKDPNARNTTVGYAHHMPDPSAAAVTSNHEFTHPWIHIGRPDQVETTTGAKFENGTFTYKSVETRDIQLGRDRRTERVDSLRLDGDTLHMTYSRREQEGTLLGWSSPDDHIIDVSFRRVQ